MITISYNSDEEMMSISQNGKIIFYGNYSDFSREPESLGKFLRDLNIHDVYVNEDLKIIYG